MSLMDSVAGPLRWARKRIDVVRKTYEDALVAVDQNGGHRIRELQHLVEGVGLSLLQHADEQLQNAQIRLDELNRHLAQEAVPDERKTRVGRLALDQKASAAAARSGRVLKEASARVQSIRSHTESGAKPAGRNTVSSGTRSKAGEGRAGKSPGSSGLANKKRH